MHLFLQQKANVPDYTDPSYLKVQANKLDRSVYEETVYLENGNKRVALQIYRRIEGSYYFSVTGRYGKEEDRDSFFEKSALNAIDSLFDENHILSRSYRHRYRVSFEHTGELHLQDTEITAQRGHELFEKLLNQHNVPIENIYSWHLYFNGWRGRVSFSQSPMCLIGDCVPPSINQDYGDKTCWLDLSRGNYPQNNLTVYLKTIEGKQDYGFLFTEFVEFADNIIAGKAEEHLADNSKGIERHKSFDILDREERPERTAEQKANLHRRCELETLSRAYADGVDVRTILERDPRFDNAEIDDFIAEMGSAGFFYNGIISALAGEIEKVIKPIEDDKSGDND